MANGLAMIQYVSFLLQFLFQEGGALKLVSDPDLTLTDAGCVSATPAA